MKLRILSAVAVTALILAIAFSVSAPAAPNAANAKAVPAAKALPVPAAATPAEPHPQIREAIGALRRAKEHMEHAAHDFRRASRRSASCDRRGHSAARDMPEV